MIRSKIHFLNRTRGEMSPLPVTFIVLVLNMQLTVCLQHTSDLNENSVRLIHDYFTWKKIKHLMIVDSGIKRGNMLMLSFDFSILNTEWKITGVTLAV